jgi:diguanylate cyclase (GGDEF)-like protein
MTYINGAYRLFEWLIKEILKLIKVSNEVYDKSMDNNYRRTYIVSVFSMVLFILLWLYFEFFVNVETGNEVFWKTGIHTTHMVLFFVFFIFSLLIWYSKGKVKPGVLKKVIVISTIGTLMVGSILLTTYEQLVSNDITPFIMYCVSIGSIFLIRPSHSLMLYIVSFGGFILGHSLTSEITANIANGLTSIFVGFVISFINWRNFTITTLQEEVINKQKSELEQMAFFDTLTKLPNRRLFYELIKKERDIIKRNKMISSIVIADLDRFKNINDTYGHPVGDSVLSQFATLIKNNLRASDTVARLGGEEFIMLFPSTNKENAGIVSEYLRSVVENHEFVCDGVEIKLTASFGVSELSIDEGETETDDNYYIDADKALYIAKQNGRNKVMVWETTYSNANNMHTFEVNK